MAIVTQGTARLFRLAGIDVSLHWSWFVVALIEIDRKRSYSSIAWNAAEYLALFLIVLMHEFGHAFACRQVGGKADKIILWPLGGIAYVNPPQRAGAVLWSIAAGPLVNVVLFPILLAAWFVGGRIGLHNSMPDLLKLLWSLTVIDASLLIFNLLPVYPLDGGQILRALLWFFVGKARSLMVATTIGLVGIAGLVGLAIFTQSIWFVVMCGFLVLNCWGGLKHSQALLKLEKLPTRPGYVCPSCQRAPAIGNFWKCSQCATQFDTFQTGATCPSCQRQYAVTSCMFCSERHPFAQWTVGVNPPPLVAAPAPPPVL